MKQVVFLLPIVVVLVLGHWCRLVMKVMLLPGFGCTRHCIVSKLYDVLQIKSRLKGMAYYSEDRRHRFKSQVEGGNRPFDNLNVALDWTSMCLLDTACGSTILLT